MGDAVGRPCFLALDVHYEASPQGELACAGAITFADPADPVPRSSHVHTLRDPAPYVPGAFYERELPALLPLVRGARARLPVTTVLVDGHVDLDAGRPGLGRHLHEALGAPPEVQVVGVAKSAFAGAPSRPVLRGGSERPLHVSATSDLDGAVALVAALHGEHRLPTLLTWVDHLARGKRPAQPEADLLDLAWSGGRGRIAWASHELERAAHVTPPEAWAAAEVELPAASRGLDQALELTLRRQTGREAWYAYVAARFEASRVGEGDETLRIALCDAPPFPLRGLTGIHAALLRGIRSVAPLPAGRLVLERLQVAPADSLDAAWERAGATLVRLCRADTAGLSPTALNALARETARLDREGG